jgi:hypothetical protein
MVNLLPCIQSQLAPRGSLLISLCNQCVAQQLQVIILKADGIPSKSAVSLAGSGKRNIPNIVIAMPTELVML